ncbi:helix-turn-helix domain-containing protein [Aneurinibacillus sp. Ricciae_BoGa-3]|uniref:helix-turn-helix domain-containing protein n=1 Tax=Aneurinibacillus sp. Ricciae_BoGa-3 TaxID=3022697 RepID=UPI0023413AFD|nr:helix-turn-helix domain-containing protein [Aneurinibacillus sp. Ricciae_BoGa-3]WCK54298.1 helix-turn-helix domain-containing protein [Aneurinibacillus sp. Ricciae_BoGa-3]
MAKSAYSAQEKYALIVAYENRQTTVADFCLEYNISKLTITEWVYQFEAYGMNGLHGSSGWKGYSKELKMSAVLDYLSENYSQYEIVRKYEISSRSVLRRWIKNYNGHRDLKETKRMKNSMTKGRSTTLEERLEIVRYCLQNGKDYHQASEQFNVSYQQVYQWVKKYEKEGEDGLKDQRGHRKVEPELTPEERAQREIKRLERENERLRAENAFLKKLEELERRRFKRRL